jgi:hypothetical protein
MKGPGFYPLAAVAAIGLIGVAAAVAIATRQPDTQVNPLEASIFQPDPVLAPKLRETAQMKPSGIGGTGAARHYAAIPPQPRLRQATPDQYMIDNTMVAVTGRVAFKDRDTLVLDRPSGQMRVVVHEQREWHTPYSRETTEKIRVGEPVTVFGKVQADPNAVPEVNADAVFTPGNKTFHVIRDPHDDITEHSQKRFIARYVPLGS